MAPLARKRVLCGPVPPTISLPPRTCSLGFDFGLVHRHNERYDIDVTCHARFYHAHESAVHILRTRRDVCEGWLIACSAVPDASGLTAGRTRAEHTPEVRVCSLYKSHSCDPLRCYLTQFASVFEETTHPRRPLNSIVAQKRWAVPGAGSTIR